MTDELRRLAAAAPVGSVSAQILNAKLAQQAAEDALVVGGGTRPTIAQTAQQAALVASVATGQPQPQMAATSLAQVEMESRDAVTVEEAQAFGLSVEEAAALAALRNEITLGVPSGVPGGSVSEAMSGETADRLDSLGLAP